MKRILFVVIVSLFVSSCLYSNKYENRELDKAEAEKITVQLFKYLRKNDFKSTHALFDKKFYEVTSTLELVKSFKSNYDEIGALLNTELISWNTMVSEGDIEMGIYHFDYNAQFEKDEAVIKISLIKNKDGTIKITGYNINSEAFN